MNSACQQFEECLSDFAEGAIDEPRRWWVEAHLIKCAGCRCALAELRWVDQVLARNLRFADVEKWAAPRMAQTTPAHPTLVWTRPVLAPAVAAIFLVVSIGWFAWHGAEHRRVVAAGDRGAAPSMPSPGSPGPRSRPNRANQRWDQQFAALCAAVDREAGAAQLAAAAEVLSAEPTLDEYAHESLRFLATAYANTVAGRAAAERLEADKE